MDQREYEEKQNDLLQAEGKAHQAWVASQHDGSTLRQQRNRERAYAKAQADYEKFMQEVT